MPANDAGSVTVREVDPPLPDAAFRLVNPAVGWLLRSPLHWLVSDGLALVTFTGRRSGRAYTTPVGYHEPSADLDGDLVLFNASGWWRNLVDGAPVTLRLRGEDVAATATAKPDEETTARYLRDLLAREGRGYARRLGFRIEGDRLPTVAELADGVEDTVAIAVELDGAR